MLEELDKDKSEALLREQTEVAEQLKAYPGGAQALKSQHPNFSYGVTDSGSGLSHVAAQQQIEQQMQERVRDVLRKVDKDPSGALASALALPVHGAFPMSSPRSDALLGIAGMTAAKKPSVAKSALDELSSIQDQLTVEEMAGIESLPQLYLNIGDREGAAKALDILLKAASKTYEKDTDNDDPNQAFKGAWPSTDLWSNAIQQAAGISPSLPEEVIAGLPDTEIAAFEKVTFASALVGGSEIVPFLVSECRKNGSSYRVATMH